MKKATKKEIEQLTIEMVKKYFDLVWFARKTEEDFQDNEVVRKEMLGVLDKYPETLELMNDKTNWTHGFNSGCLAAFRMIMSSIVSGVEEAKEEFPFLDT